MPIIDGARGAVGGRLLRAGLVAVAFAIDLWVWGGDTQTRQGGQAPAALIVVVSAVCYGCLAAWRSPLPGYIALWLLALAGMLVPSVESFAGYLLALFLMARMMPRPMALLALAASAAPVAVNTLTGASFHEDSDASFVLINAGLWVLLFLAAWVTGRVLARHDQHLATERRWAEDARTEALAVERLRISRDIHDIVGHSLTGIVLQAAGARAGLTRGTASADDLEHALASIQDAGEQSMRELHRLVGMLRETDQEEALAEGTAQLTGLVESARMSGFDVVTQVSGERLELDPSIARTAYRVVQEGLSNAMKHGGDGTRIEVTCDWSAGALTVTVRNTAGVAAPSAQTLSGGFGLVGLRERVSVSGGTLTCGPTGHGYVLQAKLPTSIHHLSKEDR